MKKPGASKDTAATSDAPKPVPEKRLEDMTLEEQLAYSAARLKKPSASKDAAPANDAPKPVPEKRVEDMTLEE